MILPDTDELGDLKIAERICFAVRRLAITHSHSQVSSHITLSAGLSTAIPDPGSNFEEIITAADKALYQAKATGRDRFRHNNVLVGSTWNYKWHKSSEEIATCESMYSERSAILIGQGRRKGTGGEQFMADKICIFRSRKPYIAQQVTIN